MATRIGRLRDSLVKFRDSRLALKELEKGINNNQGEIIALMKSADPKNNGIVFDESDKSRGTAYVQQNDGSLVWNEEEIIDWLSHPSRKPLRIKASSRVFDINKWEALVASKEVPAKIAKKFKYKTEPPSPFIRFGVKGDDSL